MKKVLRSVSLIACMFICAALMTGCGEKIAEYKIGTAARYYVANKYGFRPGTTNVELRKVGELEGVWHKKDGGLADMEYNGRTFKVYVSLKNPEIRYDDYLRPNVEDYLVGFFNENLGCEDIHVWVTYGTPVCMVPGDVKTVEDVFSKCDNVKIYVSTYGLNNDSAGDLDVDSLGKDTKIIVVDWTNKDCLEDWELIRETAVGLESDSYTNGFSKIGSYYLYSGGDVNSYENSAPKTVSADPKEADELFEKAINGEILVKASYEDGNEAFFNIPDLLNAPDDWERYELGERVDLDNDGIKELILDGPYGGKYLDARDGGVYQLAEGEGTAQWLWYAEYNGKTYICHVDNSHGGREIFLMDQYDGNGNIVESTSLTAEYWEYIEFDVDTAVCHFGDEEISVEEYLKLRKEIFGY